MNKPNRVFEPPPAALKQRLAGLTARQRALLTRRLRGNESQATGGEDSPTAITQAEPLAREAQPRVSVYPASHGQQRMWFLHYYASESPVYCVPSAYHLVGPLNHAWLEAAFATVLQRHDMLRTTFAMENDELTQRVAAESAFRLQLINLEETPAAKREAALEQCLDQETCQPFDLSAGPPFRAVLVRVSATEHALLLVLHHIISDGWSRSNFYRELAAAYTARAAGRPATVRQLPVQFADYSAWQQRWLEGGALAAQAAYWKSKLALEPEALDLPSDRPRPAVESFRGDRCSLRLDPQLTDALKARAQEEGATLFMILLAAFKVLLHRYTGRDDLIVGVPIANRQRLEVEELIGFFANTLVMRTQFAGELTFRELLRRVKDTAVEAYAHQDMPFERLVELLQVRRDASRTPLFQTTFAIQDFPAVEFLLPGIRATPRLVTTHTSKFDLSLTMERCAGGWTATAEYSTDLFDRDRMDRLLEHLHVILESVADHPAQLVSEIPILTKAERRQILVEWNRTERTHPQDPCIHHLIEAQARRTPEATAVKFAGRPLSYRALDTRADQLALHLRSLGVGPDVLVGLCVERSLEMIVAMLGILKAGGAYVPLDPQYPKERIEFILQDAAAPVLVTQRSLGFGQGVAHRVYVDEAIPPSPAASGESGVAPTNLAYLIYTSGSTGKPKGVAIEHRNTVSFLHWMRDSFSDEEMSGVLASTSICFDLSVFEIFGPLSWGGRVLLVKNALDLWSPHAPRDVTLINTVPSVLAELLRDRGLPPSIRTVNLAGEPLRQSLVDAVFQKTAVKDVNDLYGPSETTTYSTWARRRPGGVENVGRPIANTQIYVLDGNGQPVPVGVPGELYIGGVGVARGYWRRPELTAERFVPDRFSSRPGGRLFKTGDRARWLADGNLALQGRADGQVKLRGFRIELGEVETTLRAQPEIREAAVIVREDTPGNPQLVAYLDAHGGAKPDLSAIRARLATILPEYMLPSVCVWLDQLPMTPNGKVDRKAMPAPEISANGPSGGSDQPANLLELELIRLWRRLFQREAIGRHDDFFDLGGHSLLAARLTTEIEKLLGCKLPIAALFQSPTVESLARRLAEANWVPPWSSLVPLQPLGDKPPFFLVHGYGGDVFIFLGLAQSLAPDQPAYGLQAVGLDGKSARHTTVEDMAAHYIQEMRAVQPDGPYYLGGYSMGGLIAFEMAQQLQRLGQRVALLALFDTMPVCIIPWTVYGRAMASYLRGRGIHHWRRWRDLPNRNRLGYFRGRWTALQFWIARNRTKAPVTTDAPPKTAQPPRVPGFADYYQALATAYRLRPYPGRVDMFLSADATPHWVSCWPRLVPGGVTFHRLQGRHLQLLTPDYLPELTNALRAVLHHTQRQGSVP